MKAIVYTKLGPPAMGIAHIKQKDLMLLSDLLASGKVTPVIDRTYPLEKTAEAIRYLAEGHARGKVVINVAPELATQGVEQ